MSLISGLRGRIKRVKSDKTGIKGVFLLYIDRIAKALNKKTNFYDTLAKKLFTKWFKRENYYQLKNVKLPILGTDDENMLRCLILGDTFYSYLYCKDKYDEATFDKCDKFLGEGLYGLVNDKVNVTVESGDIVIDAGSWIGDFAAYSSVRGATTYAFEPSDKNFNYLVQTARLNKNIIPVKKGLSNGNICTTMFENMTGNSSANRLALMENDSSITYTESSSSVETVKLDDFVHENNLSRVDFIKSDIEGFERHMLAGAQGVLREFAPKLALCTYHLPDDPEIMADLIKQANPKYNIVQKRMKLFASVPE